MAFFELSSLVSAGSDLSSAQAAEAADLLASADVDADAKAEFLTALAKKGECAAEVAGLAGRFRELARDPGLDKWQDRAIDVCGTGGDKQGTFNVSTTVTYVIAAAGIPVFKHGNRSITSKCGSANLLDALGVDLMADDAVLRRAMEEIGFCFMFAPAFHPAFKEIMPVRQKLAEQGQRTVFNILGPLINPAKPAYQLLGVFGEQVVELMAEAQHALGYKAGLVAHCDLGEKGGMDEFSVCGMNIARGFGDLRETSERWSPEDLGLSPGPLADLEGGDLEVNKKILEDLIQGKAPKALEDTVALNAASAFYIYGRHESIAAGYDEARDLLLGGAVEKKIEQTREFYASL